MIQSFNEVYSFDPSAVSVWELKRTFFVLLLWCSPLLYWLTSGATYSVTFRSLKGSYKFVRKLVNLWVTFASLLHLIGTRAQLCPAESERTSQYGGRKGKVLYLVYWCAFGSPSSPVNRQRLKLCSSLMSTTNKFLQSYGCKTAW